MLDVDRRLTSAALPDRLARLGLTTDDRRDTLAAVATVLTAGDLPRVQRLAERLLPGIGDIEGKVTEDPWAGPDAGPEPYGAGVLPLLALLATADEVVAWHGRRGIPADLSWAALADLGHQLWVHRATYGSFGLHAHGWLRLVWSGVFFWLGRLQFNLQPDPVDTTYGWVLSTHIPPTGPLPPDAVDDAFRAAADFFPRYFPDVPAGRFHCGSWLLDPQLVAAVPDSNIAHFGGRWQLYGPQLPGDEDALFFTFRRRGEVDLESLPRDTTLQRVIIDQLETGAHWYVRHGHHPLPRGSAHDCA